MSLIVGEPNGGSWGGHTADRSHAAHELKDLTGNPESLTVRDDLSRGVDLRILPLGASITAGQGSSDGNGYREYLQQDLAGMTMQYVGSLRSGSMADNYHEGHSGFTITLVAQFGSNNDISLGSMELILVSVVKSKTRRQSLQASDQTSSCAHLPLVFNSRQHNADSQRQASRRHQRSYIWLKGP